MTQPRFGKRRWRRPERLVLDHGPVVRRKDLGVSEPVAVEAALGRRASRRHLQTILLAFVAGSAIEGVVVGLVIGHPFIATITAVAYAIAYFVVAREFGDAWLSRALRTRSEAGLRVTRLVAAEAAGAGIPAPRVLVAEGEGPNATSFALRRRSIVTTRGAEELDELALEGMIAHEVVHIRDGDSAVAALYAVLAGAPDLVGRGAGALALLSIPLWPVAFALRALRGVAVPSGREHRADVAAAMLTRYPPGIVAALEASGVPAGSPRIFDPFWFVSDGEAARERAALIAEM